jgi:hypothetical protein
LPNPVRRIGHLATLDAGQQRADATRDFTFAAVADRELAAVCAML